MVVITRTALDFIRHAAAHTDPEEFIALLRKNRKGEIHEILVIPQSDYGRGFSSINTWSYSYTINHCGTVHSHPNGNNLPSRADLRFFRTMGEAHLIIGYPYRDQDVRAFDQEGREIGLKTAEVKKRKG
jgi:proteasome lid subunit RPN8/RPN11